MIESARVGPVGVTICLIVLTLAWPIAMSQVVKMWRHTTTFFDVPEGAVLRWRRARLRGLPFAVVAAVPFLMAAWILVLDPAKPHSHAQPIQVVAFICLLIAGIAVLGIAPAIFLFNS